MAQNNYRDLIKIVRNRLDPENLIIEKSIREELASISYSDVLEYVRYAMNGVEPAYTQRSKDAGENAKTHLTNGGIANASYRYQGSIMTNTHRLTVTSFVKSGRLDKEKLGISIPSNP